MRSEDPTDAYDSQADVAVIWLLTPIPKTTPRTPQEHPETILDVKDSMTYCNVFMCYGYYCFSYGYLG